MSVLKMNVQVTTVVMTVVITAILKVWDKVGKVKVEFECVILSDVITLLLSFSESQQSAALLPSLSRMP